MRCQTVTPLPSLVFYWVLGNLWISTSASQPVADSSTVPDMYSGQIRIKAAVLLTSGSDLAFDYYNLAPVIDLALQRVLQDYDVSIELQLALYQGQCNVSQAVGQAVQAIIANVDLIIGPACTPDMIAVSQITTYYKLSLLTGAGSLTDSTDAFPWTTRASYNTYSQWLFFVTMAARYNWRTVAVIYDRDDDNNLTNAKSLIRHLLDKNFKAVEMAFKGADYTGFRSAEDILSDLMMQARSKPVF
ncbi:hypothetical protein RvY_18095 [Ramazzottius varieornatus]|uniref:Receptor ligand binding region domain-containing protein n=1 Tax=Ramazzottius varieornatus TaxID=947166 RepID=A0A1D1W4I6_RAMVA|nr:hypothetical protein RvY_18095 [Ramazzottius varieornatus]